MPEEVKEAREAEKARKTRKCFKSFKKAFFIFFNFIASLVLILTGLVLTPAFAGINEDLSSFYSSLGYDSNISASGAYHSQEAGYYAAGSSALRSKVRTLQLVYLDTPSLKSGCGGIDMFFGGFSFVNSDNLVRFLKQVMNNALGYSFNLALETMVPEIAHAMQYMQDQAQKINRLNESSCQMAEALVGGAWPRVRANQQQVCQDLGTNNSLFADWAMARQRCGVGGEQAAVLDKASKDPKYEKRVLIDKNIVWDAIKKSKFLGEDDDTATLLMNLTGTVIYREGKQEGKAQRLNDNILKTLLDGGEANVFICSDKEKCLNITEGVIKINKDKGLRSQIVKTITDIVVGTHNNTPVTPKEIGFSNSVSIPIVKFVNVYLHAGNAAQALSLTSYSDVIAKDILKKYLVELLTLARQGLQENTDYDHDIYDRFDKDINRAIKFAESIKTNSHRDIQDITALINGMRDVEKEVTAAVSENLKRNMGE